MQFKNPALNDIFYKLAEDIKNPSVFKRTLDAVLDKTIPIGLRDLTKDTINSLGFKTSSNKEYMQLREDILNGTNASVKGVVDFNNLLNAKLSKEQLRELQRYYVGDDYDSKIVTQELKDIADTVMNKINDLTQVGIKKGIFPEYYGEMKGYLKRSYEKHTFNTKGHLKSSTLEFHKLFHRGTSKYVSPKELQRMRDNGEMAVTLKDYKEGKWVISENKDSKGNIEIYRDWSKKEREKMGEIEDFSFNAARTIDTLQKQLYTHDFLKNLEAKKIIIKAESNKAPEGYVDTKGDFGIIGNPFKNYYVKAEVASDLKDTFYKLYGDWHLALASYNCGPGTVNKAIRRSGGKRDFWSIYPWLPRETRAYVPIFIAANYAMYYSDEHGICPDTLYQTRFKHREVLMSAAVDTLHSSQRQHLEQLSAVLGLPIAELRKLNPAYVRDIVPGGKDYNIVLPIDYTGAYIELQDSILAYKADSLLHKQAQMIAMAQKSTDTYSAGGITYYKVKKGDTLGAIAKRYRCSVKQLQRWNNLRSTNIQIGQKLKILK